MSMATTPAEQIAHAADRLRDLAAAGLKYAPTIYDRDRYLAIQQLAIELAALATGQPAEALEPLRDTVFARITPIVAGTAALIDGDGRILLMQRSDNRLWNMPGGILEVGETPAQGVAREVLEETGLHCEPVLLVGVYDSQRWDTNTAQQIYKFTFLCRPLDSGSPAEPPSHAHESLALGWFAEDALPPDLYSGHVQRVHDAFRAWRGEVKTYFDR
jgi:8-oxo-dGTP pyrophosphatase MutT (NUDIX family)